MTDSNALLAAATSCLNAGNVARLRELISQHPGIPDLRTDGHDALNLLHVAAQRGDAAHVIMLLDVGADPADRAGAWVEDEVPEEGYYDPGWTAMMLAARGGHRHVVKLLIEHGASVCDVGHWGDTAILFAAVSNDAATANLLLAHGAQLDVACRVKHFDEELGWHFIGTPLHAAANCGSVEVARSLLGHGAAVDQELFPCGRTPLFYASARGHGSVVDVLLRAGADPNRREHSSGYGFEVDFTPLHYAARHGDPDSVRLLLVAGADPHAIVTYSNDTSLTLAEEGGHSAAAEVISSYLVRRT